MHRSKGRDLKKNMVTSSVMLDLIQHPAKKKLKSSWILDGSRMTAGTNGAKLFRALVPPLDHGLG
jgi:hypothetical protein